MLHMEPITNALLARAVSVELLDTEGGSSPVPAELTYDRLDPFAVSLSLGEAELSVDWTFARELLAEGLHEPNGDGDVHVWPCVSDKGRAALLIELWTQDGRALLQADPREIVDFLAMSHEIVAPGQESAHLDLDEAIAAIFAAEPPRS